MMTPAELDQRGTRVYSADPATGVRAATIALRTLGFEITAVDPASGTIKTAPRDIMNSATMTGGGAATSQRDELSWVLVVTPQGNSIQVKATPHGFINGNEVPSTQFPAESIEPKFAALWNELDQDIKQAATSS
jgi:hypothetical protein